LAERGLGSVRDLLAFLPLGMTTFRTRYPLSALATLPTARRVVVQGSGATGSPGFFAACSTYTWNRRGGTASALVSAQCGHGQDLRQGQSRRPGRNFAAGKDGSLEMSIPATSRRCWPRGRHWSSQSGLGLRPRYPAVEKVPGRVVEKLVAAAVERAAGLVPDVLPGRVAQGFGFPSIAESLRQVHQPEASLSDEKLAELLVGQAPAQQRLAFEDLFVVQVGLALERARRPPGHGLALCCRWRGGAHVGASRAALCAHVCPGTRHPDRVCGSDQRDAHAATVAR